MTDDELFLKFYKNVLTQMEEELADTKRSDGANKEIADFYKKAVKVFKKVLPSIKEVYDIFTLEEEEFLLVIEVLESYMEYFILDGTNPKLLKQQEKELEQLSQIFDQFYDDEDDDEYDEDEE